MDFPVFKTAYSDIGVYICYDRHFPEGARILGLNGAEIMFNPSATVAGLSEYLWELEQPAHAVANGYFVGAINRVGTEAPWNIGEFYGSSYFCNPRGSQGYGEGQAKVIANNWGSVDYADIMAWADHVAQLPYIDEDKMGVAGGSYGGYMTGWILGHTDRFKAAVAQRVVSNLLSLWGTSDFNWGFQQGFDNKPPWEDLENLSDVLISPNANILKPGWKKLVLVVRSARLAMLLSAELARDGSSLAVHDIRNAIIRAGRDRWRNRAPIAMVYSL